MNNLKLNVVFILALGITLGSCRKDKFEVDTAAMNNEGVGVFVDKMIGDDEDAVTLKGMMGGGQCNWQLLLASCATVTESSEDFPKTITIDYGDGCTNANGVTRSGKIIIDISDDMMNTGATRTVNFEDFFINNWSVEGTRVTVNLGPNDEGQPQFSRVADHVLVKNGNTFIRNFEGTITWLSGYDTEECGDNVWQLTGGGTLQLANGTVLTRTITTPLVFDRECGYVISGVIEIEKPQGIYILNFGDGTCDDVATFTDPEGTIHTIDLNP